MSWERWFDNNEWVGSALEADCPVATTTLSGVAAGVIKSLTLPVASLSLFANEPITLKAVDAGVAQFAIEGVEPTLWKKIAHLAADSLDYDDENLDEGEYCYFVTAINIIGRSDPSNIACAEILSAGQSHDLPIAEFVLTGVGPTVSREYNSAVAQINLGGVEPTLWKKIAELPASSVDYTDENLDDGNYCYFITGANTAGESQPSNIECVLVDAGQIHALPIATLSLVGVVPSSSKQHLAPVAQVSLQGVVPVVASESVDAPIAVITLTPFVPTLWKKIAELDVSITDYTDEELPSGEYFYFVTGANASGDSEPSNIVSATVESGQTHAMPIAEFVLSGNTPTTSKELVSPVASVTLSGVVPDTPGQHFLPVAQIVVNGVVPTASKITDSPEAASITLQGVSSDTSKSALSPIAQITLQGLEPETPGQTFLPIAQLQLVGVSPTTSKSDNAPEAAILTLQGVAPESVIVVDSGAATFTLQGVEPEVQSSDDAPRATIFLQGVSGTTAKLDVLPQSELTLQGIVPTAGVGLDVPIASLILTAMSPVPSKEADSGAATIALAGVIGTTFKEDVMPIASFTLTGHAPTVGVFYIQVRAVLGVSTISILNTSSVSVLAVE